LKSMMHVYIQKYDAGLHWNVWCRSSYKSKCRSSYKSKCRSSYKSTMQIFIQKYVADLHTKVWCRSSYKSMLQIFIQNYDGDLHTKVWCRSSYKSMMQIFIQKRSTTAACHQILAAIIIKSLATIIANISCGPAIDSCTVSHDDANRPNFE
jgi:hypothetical protein